MRISFITLLIISLSLGCGKQKVAHAPAGQSHAEDVLTYEDSEEAHAAAKAKAAAETKGPSTIVEIANPIIEKAIRKSLKKPTGELTKADYEKVTYLNFYNKQLTDVKGLEKLTQLEGLRLDANKLTDVKGLENLTQLTDLLLEGNQLTDVKDLEKLPQLKALDLSSNKLTSVNGLEKLTQLTDLLLEGNKLTNVKGLEKLTQLKELRLDYNKLTDVKGLEKLTKLRFLNLKNNPDLTKAQIAELKKVLPRCKIYPLTKEESAKVIEAAIRKATKKPTGELTKADYEKVTYLNFYNKQLTDVKGLEKLTQLKHLNLNNNQLTSLKGLENLTQLRFMGLNSNQLTSVKGLENLTKLTELYLEDNPDLTKTQIDELQKALPNCYITSNPTK